MNLTGILSITGKPGLYKVISQQKTSLIVESLEDGRRMPVHGSSKVSALSDISIYTVSEDVPLADVFRALFKHTGGNAAPGAKANDAEIKAFVEEAFPAYDKERVYMSDLKKLVKWYNLLLEKGLIDDKEEETAAEEEAETKSEVKEEDKPKSTKGGKAEAKKSEAKKPAAAKSVAPKSPGKSAGTKPASATKVRKSGHKG